MKRNELTSSPIGEKVGADLTKETIFLSDLLLRKSHVGRILASAEFTQFAGFCQSITLVTHHIFEGTQIPLTL